MTFHEKTARQFDEKAVAAWVKYSKTENPADKDSAQWFDRAAAKHWALVEAPKAEAQPVKTRCPHYKAIQTFFAIARDAGLDISKAARPKMRHAMESFMGRCVNSRGEVSGAEWGRMGAAIKSGRLVW